MDSNSASKENKTDIDIRDVGNYLLGKLWIILLVTVGLAILAFIYTSVFVTPLYSSTSNMFIINTASGGSSSASGWSIGKQYAVSGPKIITLDFCDNIADKLNNGDYDDYCEDILGEGVKFKDYYKGTITGRYILSSLNVTSDEDTCIITIKATTADPKLSAVISNVIATSFEAHYKSIIETDSVRTSIIETGKVPSSPSNVHKIRTTIIAGIVGLILACAVLVVIYILDDKIKTPDDIEKQLKLSVLGTIPDMDNEA